MAAPPILQILVPILFLLLILPVPTIAQRRGRGGGGQNPFDSCWRNDPRWSRNRQALALCSGGFSGKMRGNVGRGLIHYTVTDPSDDPIRPRRGTLRYGATVLRGKVWISFARSMVIKLRAPLLVSSYTAIDGRGAMVEIAYGAGVVLEEVTDVIVHGINFHHISPHPGGVVAVLGGGNVRLGLTDGDALRLVGASKVWVDHNTFYAAQDGLVDVTRGSTGVTVSSNWFKDHDKVMLLGHDDRFVQDKRMRVTVAFNRFGPRANQRMPRIRHGYAHVVNNLYEGWGDYAIGGSMNPIIRSEANQFVGSGKGKKDVTWREGAAGGSWNWRSVGDAFTGGAFFTQTGRGAALPGYNRDQAFAVGTAAAVRALTSNAGALRCSTRSKC